MCINILSQQTDLYKVMRAVWRMGAVSNTKYDLLLPHLPQPSHCRILFCQSAGLRLLPIAHSFMMAVHPSNKQLLSQVHKDNRQGHENYDC